MEEGRVALSPKQTVFLLPLQLLIYLSWNVID